MDYAFDDDVNPKGRVFHYVLNEDNEITKMIEVATENGDEDYTYTDKTDAVRVNNRNYWLDEADVIFAVEITGNEFWNDKVYDASEGDVNVSDGLGSAMSDTYRVGGQDLDEDSVIAVSADEIPDIGDNESLRMLVSATTTTSSRTRTAQSFWASTPCVTSPTLLLRLAC